jgi:hypothetical protein
MKSPRIIALLLTAIFGAAGITQAAVIRRQSEETAPLTQKMDQSPIAEDMISATPDDSGVELMKKAKKKAAKKKKKSKAS